MPGANLRKMSVAARWCALDCTGRLELVVKYLLLGIAAFIVVAACMAGDGPRLMRSVVHSFGWDIGRELVHGVVHHALR
jgi:hypothetical protein